MKKYLIAYFLIFGWMLAISANLANASETEKLAHLAKSCESSQHYQDCVRNKFFNNLK